VRGANPRETATGEAVASEVAFIDSPRMTRSQADEDFVDFVAQDEASSVETERRREEAASQLTRHARVPPGLWVRPQTQTQTNKLQLNPNLNPNPRID
jgi:hypothetical protein